MRYYMMFLGSSLYPVKMPPWHWLLRLGFETPDVRILQNFFYLGFGPQPPYFPIRNWPLVIIRRMAISCSRHWLALKNHVKLWGPLWNPGWTLCRALPTKWAEEPQLETPSGQKPIISPVKFCPTLWCQSIIIFLLITMVFFSHTHTYYT